MKTVHKNGDAYWAIQAITSDGEKCLSWQQGKYFYFCTKYNGRKTNQGPPPTLFNKRKDAVQALNNIPEKGANLKQFEKVVTPKSRKIVKVVLSEL